MSDKKFNKEYENLLSAVNSALSELADSKNRVVKDGESISKAYSAQAKNGRSSFNSSVSSLTARLGADNALLNGLDVMQKGKKQASDTSHLAYSRYAADLNGSLAKGQTGKARAERKTEKSAYGSAYRTARTRQTVSAKIRKLSKPSYRKHKPKNSSGKKPDITPSFEDLMIYAQQRRKAGEPLAETINYMKQYLGGNMFKAIDLYAQGTGTEHLKVDREYWNASSQITPEERRLLRLKYMGVPLNG